MLCFERASEASCEPVRSTGIRGTLAGVLEQLTETLEKLSKAPGLTDSRLLLSVLWAGEARINTELIQST